MSIIQVNNLQKYFYVRERQSGNFAGLRTLFSNRHKLIRAVDDVSFEVDTGEMIGYLGPNGAGKSTTIKMLTGLLVPTSGDILVKGFCPWRDRKHYVANIGAVFGQRTTLWWDLPVIESFELLQHIYQIPSLRFKSNLNEFRSLLELDAFLDTPVRALSLGQRMRADICAALIHDPSILFLDEPTIGLDVVAKERIRQFIQYINHQRGVTIILTTHDLSEIEKLCDRVLIIDQGRLVFDGQLESIRQKYGGKRLLVVDFAEMYTDYLINGAHIKTQQGSHVTYEFERGSITASELISRVSQRFRIRDLQVIEPEIEDTIRRIYEENLLNSAS